MLDDSAKYGKAFLGKLLTVVAIPAIVYYCVTQPQEKEKERRMEQFYKDHKDDPIYKPFDPFKEEREEWQQSIPTVFPRDSLL